MRGKFKASCFFFAIENKSDKIKVMNRNILKVIAVLSMLIDHIGAYLFPNILIFRIIGRLAFPIFAFFIAEGWKHTRSKKKYFLLIILFAVISQVPYYFLGNAIKLNILFTFMLSLGLIYFIDNFKTSSIISMLGSAGVFLLALLGELLGVIDYGLLGVMLSLAFYYLNLKWLKILVAGILLAMLSIKSIIFNEIIFENFIQFFSLLSLILLVFYNGKKGKLNLKYFFYVFYPLHLGIIWLVSICI